MSELERVAICSEIQPALIPSAGCWRHAESENTNEREMVTGPRFERAFPSQASAPLRGTLA